MQATTVFAVVLALGLVSGKAVVPNDDSFDNYIKAVLEMLRAAMPTGIPDLGIPVLDPFAVPHFDIPHIEEGAIKLDATIDDLVVTNLASFETRVAHVDLELLSLDLELFVPLLRADAIYSLDGVIFSIFPVFGEGAMFLEINELDLTAKAALTLSEEGFIQVGLLNIDATFGSINVHFDNLVGGGDFGEVINQIISLLGKQIWDLVKPSVLTEVSNALMGVLNDALSKCSLADILAGTCEFKATLEQKTEQLHRLRLLQ